MTPAPAAPAGPSTPLGRLHALYEQAEARAGSLAERAVASSAFAELLATTATNCLALSGMLTAAVDRGVRATGFAGRADVVDLARQLARTEDKLERLLEQVHELSGQLAAGRPVPAAAMPPARPAPSRARPRAGDGTGVRASR